MRHQTHKPRRGGSQAFACPVCAKKFKRADHYRSHIQERHEHSLQGAPLWNLDHDDAQAALENEHNINDVFQHVNRPVRRGPIATEELRKMGADGSAVSQYETTINFVAEVCAPILRTVSPESGLYVADLEVYQRALRAHEERTRIIYVCEHKLHVCHHADVCEHGTC